MGSKKPTESSTSSSQESRDSRENRENKERRIIIVSDGTGETAAQIVKAAMVQFMDQFSVSYTRYKNVRSLEQIKAICDDAGTEGHLIVFTIVSPQLRRFLAQTAKKKHIPHTDLLGPLLVDLGGYFGQEPTMVAGLLHNVDDAYFRRIDAMEYTIQHDDGKEVSGLDQADLIVIGLSRTSKTPLSMYLSHQGWKVANVPLILGYSLPEELFRVDQRRIIGLTIDSEALARIRRARLTRLGQHEGGEYASLEKVQEEVEYANEIYRRNRKWPIFNVTGKALEETASEIIKLMTSRKLAPLDLITEREFDLANRQTREATRAAGTGGSKTKTRNASKSTSSSVGKR